MNIVKPIYYLLIFVFVVGTTLVIPMFLAEESELAQLNTELDNLKNERGTKHLDLDDPEAKAILDRGTTYFKGEYVSFASTTAVVICCVALLFVYFFKDANKYDPLYILGIFAVLVLIGAVKPIFFVVITVVCAGAYMAMRNRLMKLRGG